jgi:hypothetical protein
MSQSKTKKGVKRMETSKEVVEKKAAPPAVATDLKSWGKREIHATSVMIPRVLKMEFMSDKVKEGHAKFGEFRDSLSDEVVGTIDKPLVLIPIEVQEKWAIYDLVEKKGKTSREFREIVVVDGSNESWKYKETGLERDRIMDVYCLLEEDLKNLPKNWKELGLKPLPKIFGFRRTSLRAGKKLYTQMYITNQSKNLPPPAVTIEVSGKKVDGDLGTYIVLDTKPGRNATPDEMQLAFHWYQAIKSGQTKADETELTQAEGSADLSEVKDF